MRARSTCEITAIALGFCILSLVACSGTTKQSAAEIPHYEELRRLKVEKAANEARKSLESGDSRLLAVEGYAIDVPGVEEDWTKTQATCGIKVIEGTSDAINSPQQKQLIDNARAYAERYNQSIASEMRKQRESKCRPIPRVH
jgi:hypothetical protein